MRFDGEFRVPGRPDAVFAALSDVERMARCMPGASLEGTDENGDWFGVMTVAFGPKRIRFKGRLACDFDASTASGTLRGRGAADLRAARVAAETRFSVKPEPSSSPDAPVSIVGIVSEAQLGGVIAEFARTGGQALADALMAEFAKNLAEDLIRTEPSSGEAAKALSAGRLVWSAVKTKLGRP